MLLRLILVSVLTLPMSASAHNWLDDLPALTSDDIDMALTQMRDVKFDKFVSRPMDSIPYDVFDELSLRLVDENSTILRLLFMFEAIRTGVIDENGEPNAEYLLNFNDRTHLKDRNIVLDRYEEIYLWYQTIFESN